MLNGHKDEIYAVRGNCEAEVDQMVLEFPVLADYMLLFDGTCAIYATHGHVYNEKNLPPMKKVMCFCMVTRMYFGRNVKTGF